MQPHTILLLIINFAVPFLLICVSIPLVLGKVPPNHWYGFRTPKTFSSEAIWYKANKIGGKYLIVAAVCQLAAVLILLVWPGSEVSGVVWRILPVAPMLIALLAWFVRMRDL